MIDELTIYNLSVKYPCTVDLVREIENIARADAIDEFAKIMKSEFGSLKSNEQLIDRISEQLKEQKDE